MLIKQEKYITGEPEGDIVSVFFQELIKYKGIDIKNPNTFTEIKTIEQNDDWLHMLIIKDVLKATVIERRDDFNYVEYTFCSWL